MKPRIVILSAFLSPMRSGAEACAEEVPLALQHEFDFTIVTARMCKCLPKTDKLDGTIPIIRVGLGTTFDKWLFPFLAPVAVKKLKPDLVHAVLETFAGMALMVFRLLSIRTKTILTCQTTNRQFLKQPIVSAPHTVTAISRVLVEQCEGYRRDTVIYIPNGLHYNDFQEAQRRMKRVSGRIVFVGRLEKMKGIDTLIRAFAGTSKPATLRIIGEGSQRRSLEQLVTDLGLADRVEFAGYVKASTIAEEYAQAEIFCGLSRSEALGNVFLEAQAAGCGVIGTRVGGIPDSIDDGNNGLLVEVDDIEAATDALNRLLVDDKLRSDLVTMALKVSENYDWQNIAQRYRQVYEEELRG